MSPIVIPRVRIGKHIACFVLALTTLAFLSCGKPIHGDPVAGQESLISPAHGAVVGKDGLLLAPERRIEPGARRPLAPGERWTVPQELIDQTAFQSVLVLRAEDVAVH